NYLSDDISANKLKEEIISKYDVEVLTFKCDISNEDSVKEMIDIIKEKFSSIDYLINNAGIAIDSTIEDKTVKNFKRILDVNLIGTFIMCKYIGNLMMSQGYGSIVNISSTNAIDSYYPYSMDYDASKSGVISLTHNFAASYAPNVRVNCVCPGWVNTDALKEMDEEQINEECKHILLGRFAETREIAEAVYFTANSKYLNDSILKIDGGRC
ncbi:MAG: SDR family oxidoreductase, partial [Bacilli bacterium]|nr:SDR family oxidoreductase [Bacilli bacterium]